MAKNRTIEHNPSFFKILINKGFTTKLRLPRAFVQEHGKSFGEDVRLRLSFARRFWKVKILQKIEDEEEEDYYFMGNGWTKFTEDMGLEMFEFVVFWFVGNSTFDVSVYAVTGCERGLPPLGMRSKYPKLLNVKENEEVIARAVPKLLNVNENQEVVARAESPEESDGPNPHFEIVFKKYHIARLELRRPFARAANLIGKKSVRMEYPGGRRVVDNVEVVTRKRKCGFQVELAGNWKEFSTANKMVVRKMYSFEFIRGKNVIQVRPLQR